ncbi:hypothetical protein B1987_13700 [Mycobacterium kansasii]|uniref:Uncharacterized protein n=1 Tax=Mycobacterium attenuatum TaxID=2341086 RepID=A0A498QGU3_9MYCO|nr:hypothetical protein [Mycobacterium attenuatum]ORB84675.1 hypothetical protein B1987_13700 [Mycobacterium kansasii]VBA43954.1 hypothetical protein LAUMK136_05360 [Mycobacterium attenuatum]
MTQAIMASIGASSWQSIIQHADNPYYGKAIRRNPNYAQAIDLRHKAVAARAAHIAARPQPPAMPATVNDDLDHWLTTTAHTAAADAEWSAKDQALAALIAHCEARIQGIGMDRDTILKSLNDDLDQLMARAAHAVEQLNGAHTPAEVVAAGVGDVWNELAELRHDYDQIRQAQASVMTGLQELGLGRSNYLFDDPLASDTAIANLDHIFPAWRDRTTPTPVSFSPSWDGRAQPWPKDPVGQLVWIVTSGAQAWTPTTSQLNTLWAKRRETRAHPQPTNEVTHA